MQVTIKITKWRVVLAIIMLILCNKVYKYCTQPFMFELFGSQEAAQKYFDEKYPIGTDVFKIIQDVAGISGKCAGSTINAWDRQDPPPKEDFEYDGIYGCTYYNDFFSTDPMHHYAMYFYIDKENRILKHYFIRFSNEYLP